MEISRLVQDYISSVMFGIAADLVMRNRTDNGNASRVHMCKTTQDLDFGSTEHISDMLQTRKNNLTEIIDWIQNQLRHS